MKPDDILYRCHAYIDDMNEVVVRYDEFQVLRETADGEAAVCVRDERGGPAGHAAP